jgi:acetyl-CoA/propionyl-CoA carboxylase biotin carboxyl carrier protein
VVDPSLRSRIGESAIAIAKAAGYVNAGTVEFLVDEEGGFYFIEMNARLQVEHPVTEMVTGLDLVRLQILVAMGERVEEAPTTRGHAIECRINAEDPLRDFLPGPGLISRFEPPGGPFVRLDAGFGEGRRIPGDYDSLFGKLIVAGEDRELARRRMLRALDEFHVEGVPTTIPFHRWVLQTPDFRDGTIHTKWVEEVLASGGVAQMEKAERERGDVPVGASAASATKPIRLFVEVDGHRVPVSVWGDDARVAPAPPSSSAHGHAAGGSGEIVAAPMQGTILQVLVEAGQEVKAGQTVCILEAMKMENHIAASREGTVSEVAVSKGDVVDTGQPLVFIE